MQEWDWQGELRSVESERLRVELAPEDVCRLARLLPGDDPLLSQIEIEMQESGFWRLPATA